MKMMRHYFENLLSSVIVSVQLQVILVCLCTSNINYRTVVVAEPEDPAEVDEMSPPFVGVFAFGDSMFDTGNNNNLTTVSKCNFPPYGRDFIGGVPTGRFSNGKIYPDFIVEALGIKQLLPAYLDPNLRSADLPTGVCFASGSSGYDPRTATPLGVLTLSDQLELFKDYRVQLVRLVGEERAKTIIAKSLFLLLSGSNDIMVTYPLLTPKIEFHSYAALLVSFASTFLKGLYSLGERRIGVLTVPLLGCIPFQRNGGGLERECLELQNERAKMFNSMLSSEFDTINSDFPDAKLVLVDIYHPLLELNQNPQNQGFEEVKFGCCGSGTVEVTSFLCNPLIEYVHMFKCIYLRILGCISYHRARL